MEGVEPWEGGTLGRVRIGKGGTLGGEALGGVEYIGRDGHWDGWNIRRWEY